MKVRDLIKELFELDQDAEVVLAADAEGNEFGKLEYVVTNHYCYAHDSEVFYDAEGHVPSGAFPCVVLWP